MVSPVGKRKIQTKHSFIMFSKHRTDKCCTKAIKHIGPKSIVARPVAVGFPELINAHTPMKTPFDEAGCEKDAPRVLEAAAIETG